MNPLRRFVQRSPFSPLDLEIDTRSDTPETVDRNSRSLFSNVHSMSFATRAGLLTTRKVKRKRDVLVLARVESTGHRIALTEESVVTLLLPTTGSLLVSANGRDLAAGEQEGLLLGPGHRTTTVLPRDNSGFRAFVVMLPVPERGEGPGTDAALDPMARLDPVCAKRLVRFVAKAFPQLMLPPDQARAEEQRMLWEMLRDLAQDLIDLSSGPGPDMAPSSAGLSAARVRRAIGIMRERFDEKLSIDDLASALGIGRRSLQLAFIAHQGSTPRDVLTRIRLDQVRQRLLKPREDAQITDIALECGFSHLGRFAATYQKTFGEKPSDTLRRSC